MKPAPLVYERPKDVLEAVRLLSEMEWGARILAGGQSLMPMLNLRLVPLVKLIDISRIAELRGATIEADCATFGACIRHGEFEDGTVPDVTNGLMQRVASQIAYRAIRNRGTIGGSVSLADPSADWIPLLIALSAEFQVVGPHGERQIDARSMFQGPYTTNLSEHEVLCFIRVPKLSRAARSGYYKIIRKAGEYPMTIAAAVKDVDRERSSIVLAAANRPQMVLPKCSQVLGRGARWSDEIKADLVNAYHEDMTDASRADDQYELKICETTVLRAVMQALDS